MPPDDCQRKNQTMLSLDLTPGQLVRIGNKITLKVTQEDDGSLRVDVESPSLEGAHTSCGPGSEDVPGETVSVWLVDNLKFMSEAEAEAAATVLADLRNCDVPISVVHASTVDRQMVRQVVARSRKSPRSSAPRKSA